MQITQIDNFLEEPTQVYEKCKKLPFYSLKEFNKKFNEKQNWPGVRTQSIPRVDKIIFETVIKSMITHFKDLFQKDVPLEMYVHKRNKNIEKQDWMHTDHQDGRLYTALLYLSKTNLNSGTMFYNVKKQPITDVKFVQNRMVLFDSRYLHSAYGHHNGRLNVTISIYGENK
jgi:hypothetical protein